MEKRKEAGLQHWADGSICSFNRLHEAEDIKLYGAHFGELAPRASPLGRSAREVLLSKALVWKLMCHVSIGLFNFLDESRTLTHISRLSWNSNMLFILNFVFKLVGPITI